MKIQKIRPVAENWLKNVFGVNFLISKVLFPLSLLVVYFLSFEFLLRRAFELNYGVNFNYAVRSTRYFSILAAISIIFLVIVVMIKRNENLAFNNPIEKFTIGDIVLVLLPLTPVVQYLLNNQSILSLSESVLVTGFFIVLSSLYIYLIPTIFRKVGSPKILVSIGLSFTFSITYMAILTQENNWFDVGSLRPQWLVLVVVFLASWITQIINGKSLLRIIILVFFVTNTGLHISLNDTGENNSSETIEENKLVLMVEGKAPSRTPNVYLLVYDSYVTNETMLGYGIDNSSQEEYLADLGFNLYPHTYSVGNATKTTMARVLNASTTMNYSGTEKDAMAGGGAVMDIFSKFGYQTVGLFATDYFFREDYPRYDISFPDLKTSSGELLLKAILMGEFRFDLSFDEFRQDDFINLKENTFEDISGKPAFIYMHSRYPGHSQNSRVCLPDETDLFKSRLQEANKEMRRDVDTITEHDPGAIIIVAGDHGPYLTKNCYRLHLDYDISEVSRLDIQDRFGTFLAIRWPTQDFESYDDITVLQDLFPSIFAYLFSDTNILETKIEPVTISQTVIVRNGIIDGGIDDGEPLYLSGQ